MFQILKFSPSISLFGGISTTAKKKELFAEFSHKFTCWHQGNLAQYYCLANEFHKDLRLKKEYGGKDEYLKCRTKLDHYLNGAYKKAWQGTMQFANSFYQDKGAGNPRFSLKSSLIENDKEVITDIFRGNGPPKMIRYPVTENTGFDECRLEGKYFICNNIPAAAKRGHYKNPRLVKQMVENYKPPGKLSKRKKGIDKSWAKCWEKYAENIPHTHRSAYRSTLITPLTLTGNELEREFIELTHLGKNADRYIFGFFCMDHPGLDFFDDIDVSLSYIVADWLSLYLIPRTIFTTSSETYNSGPL